MPGLPLHQGDIQRKPARGKGLELGTSYRKKACMQLAILKLFAEECTEPPSSGLHMYVVQHPTGITNMSSLWRREGLFKDAVKSVTWDGLKV